MDEATDSNVITRLRYKSNSYYISSLLPHSKKAIKTGSTELMPIISPIGNFLIPHWLIISSDYFHNMCNWRQNDILIYIQLNATISSKYQELQIGDIVDDWGAHKYKGNDFEFEITIIELAGSTCVCNRKRVSSSESIDHNIQFYLTIIHSM